MIKKTVITLFAFVILSGCRKGDPIIGPTDFQVAEETELKDITGFYLLNEGNMGSNNATLDYFDYGTGTYHKNIYADRNPGIVKELGDFGNDLQIYGNKLYAVINCSHFVEVMNVTTAKHLAQISIPNCRFITFKDKYAYVSSFAGPVQIDPNARLGYVAKIDTTSMKVIDECTVGYQPEQMVIVGDKLYVANSGGYRAPDYDRTVSVINLDSFEVVKTIDVAINLHGMVADRNGYIYVSSAGNHKDRESKTFLIDSRTDEVIKELPLLPNSQMDLYEEMLYVLGSGYNDNTKEHHASYVIWNTDEQKIEGRCFIKDGTEKDLVVPYGLAINPENGDILLTDAKDYVTPGVLHCYSHDGMKKWSVTTGDIPAHFAFTTKKVTGLD